MAPFIKMFGMLLMVVMPGGLLVMGAFILVKLVAARLRASEQGPHRYRRAFANLSLKDVWAETRKSL